VAGALAAAQEIERPVGGVVDFRSPVLPDPVLQHSKETYILYGCAYCHGVDLKVRNGEAADLLHSRLVGADVDGSVISPLLRNGIPQTTKMSPMPQFSDLSGHQISEIVQWIHYARQEGHYKELMDTKLLSGNAAAGKLFAGKNCTACHAQAELGSLAQEYDATSLKAHVLKPAQLISVRSFRVGQIQQGKSLEGRKRHGTLLENYAPRDLADLYIPPEYEVISSSSPSFE